MTISSPRCTGVTLKRSVDLAPLARIDLQEIWDFSAEKWGVDRADAYVADLHAAMARLAQNPEMARLRGDIGPPVRILSVGSHRLIYRHDEATLQILRVVHMRRHWPGLIVSRQ